MLNKNPEQNDDSFKIKSIVKNSVLNSVMCSDSFTKSAFMIKLLNEADMPIVYLDFDLLYSGYITAKMISSPEDIRLFRPTKKNWGMVIKDTISSTTKRTIFVIDSLNGFFSLFYDKKDLGIMINSYIMLFVYIAKTTDSHVIITSLVNKKNDEVVLSLFGRQTLELKNMSKVFLDRENLHIRMSVLSNNTAVSSHQFPIDPDPR